MRSSAARLEVTERFEAETPSMEKTPPERMSIPPVPESMSIPAVVVTAWMAIESAVVEADVSRISVVAPTVVMSKSSPARSPVTEISIPPAVVVICMASASVPAEERMSEELKTPARAMVRSSAAPLEVRVRFEEVPVPSMEKDVVASMVMASAESMSMSPPTPVASISTEAVPVPFEVK